MALSYHFLPSSPSSIYATHIAFSLLPKSSEYMSATGLLARLCLEMMEAYLTPSVHYNLCSNVFSQRDPPQSPYLQMQHPMVLQHYQHSLLMSAFLVCYSTYLFLTYYVIYLFLRLVFNVYLPPLSPHPACM